MKLTMLGTGGAFTRVRSNYHNNALLEVGGRRYLIDCSIYAFDALAENHDLGPEDIDGVLLTHFHGDHASGLEELAFRSFLAERERPELYCRPDLLPRRSGVDSDFDLDLWENSLRGGLGKIRDLDGTPVDAGLETYFEPRVAETFELEADSTDVELRWHPTDHVPEMASFGLAIQGLSTDGLYFTGDARPKEPAFYETYDTILHDCLPLPHYPGTLHTHLEELLELPESLQERIHIMHYGDIDEATEKTAGEPVGVAKPGSTFQI